MSENNIKVILDPVSVRVVRNLLGNLKNKTPSALKNAVNMTARRIKKKLPDYAKERYIVKASAMKKKIALKKAASASSLGSIISVKGKPLQLIYFQTRKNGKKTAAKARGKIDRSLKEIISSETGAKAFITEIDNGTDENGNARRGHKAIVQRLTKNRYPLVTFAGPTNPEMLGNSETFKNIEPDIQEELSKNIIKQIQRIRGGKR